MDTYTIYDSSICFNNHDAKVDAYNRWDGSLPHYRLFIETMYRLWQMGFCVLKDKDASDIIRKDYYCGSCGELRFKARRYPAGFQIEFYQNIVHENPNGGYYDFARYAKMPYLQKLIFRKITNKLKIFFESRGIGDATEPLWRTSEQKIKYDFVKSSHHPQSDMNFDLSDLNGMTPEEYNNKDRDSKTIYNGQVKYFRDHKGYLCRGTVYHNINNMWWVIINQYQCRNMASFQLFDLTEEDERGRLAVPRIPESCLQRKRKLAEASTKELIAELRKRGKSVI